MPASDNPFRAWIRLEQPRLGTRVTHASDEFFAAKERLIEPADPVFIEDKYDDHGKWMDGWESRRRRTPGHDFCIVRLGVPGIVHGVDIDTRHFTGNFPPQASIDACVSDDDVPESGWTEIVPRTDLAGDRQHFVAVNDNHAWTHLRLNIYPDGGIARLRIYGEVRADIESGGVIDLFALEERRPGARSERRTLRQHAQSQPARPRREHGRRLGDGAPARAGQRLGDRRARQTRRRRAGGGRYCALQGQLPGPGIGRSRAVRQP